MTKQHCYVIENHGEFFNGKTQSLVKRKHLASIFMDKENAIKVKNTYKVNGKVKRYPLTDFTDLYQKVSFDLAINLQYMLEVFSHFHGNFKAFTKVDSELIQTTNKAVELIKKGNNEVFKMYESYSDEFSDTLNDLVSCKLVVVEALADVENEHLQDIYDFIKSKK